jgi:hypothetical protein
VGNVLDFKPIGETEEKTEVDVRVLTQEEIESLRPEFEAVGAIMPNPASSFAVGAVDASGKVIAFLFFQLQVHAEPMKIEHPHEALFKRLVDVGERTLEERCGPCLVYAFTPAGKVTKLAQAAGMQLEPWVVMSKICGLPKEKVQ